MPSSVQTRFLKSYNLAHIKENAVDIRIIICPMGCSQDLSLRGGISQGAVKKKIGRKLIKTQIGNRRRAGEC